MQAPLFVDGQFVDGTLLNGAMSMLMNNYEFIGSELHTPGLLSPTSMVFIAGSPSALQVTINLPSPFAVLFADGALVNANGIVSGATTTAYAVNLASLVPASGTATVYILASYGQIGEQQTQVIGPPEGHPDYDPTFAPFNWYLEGLDTLVITAGTTAADNETTFELCRLSLAAGQTTINQSSIITSNWKYASAVLSPTGVTAGTYAGATVQVGADGRLTGVSGVAYGPLAGNNTWTGTNIFDEPITVTDTGTGGLVVNGGGNGANIELLGGGTTTPNKYIRAISGELQILNSAYDNAPLTLTDAGSLYILGALSAPAGVNAGGGEIQTSGALSAGSLYVGTTATVEAALDVGTTIDANGQIYSATGISTAGNIDATGYLVASHGAYGTGNGAIATTLSDFRMSAADEGYMIFPNGFIIQWGAGASVTGADFITFPTPFPNVCLSLSVGEGNPSGWVGGTGPTIFGAMQLGADNFALYVTHWTGSSWTLSGGIAFRYVAVGF
jgi:hypothetical protein